MNRAFYYNPFIVIAGLESFFIGLTGLLLTSYLSYFTGTHFTGLLNLSFAKDSDFWVFLVENVSDWIILSLLLFIGGSILSKSRIRIIDVLGTVLLSRIPLVIAPAFRIIPFFRSFAIYSAAMYLIAGIYVISLIWCIVLSFNAYKVSCNLKNESLFISFIVIILLSEIITEILLHTLI
jgi:hypothetical protein